MNESLSIEQIKNFSESELAEYLEQLKRNADEPRPKTWSPGTVASYYKRYIAIWLKTILDEMAKDHTKEMFFSTEKFKTKRRTLAQKINQGWLFLTDNLDPTGIYKQLREEIS